MHNPLPIDSHKQSPSIVFGTENEENVGACGNFAAGFFFGFSEK